MCNELGRSLLVLVLTLVLGIVLAPVQCQAVGEASSYRTVINILLF